WPSKEVGGLFAAGITRNRSSELEEEELPVETGETLPHFLTNGKGRLNALPGRSAHQARSAQGAGELFHPENEINFIAQQAFFTQRSCSADKDLSIVQDHSESWIFLLLLLP